MLLPLSVCMLLLLRVRVRVLLPFRVCHDFPYQR